MSEAYICEDGHISESVNFSGGCLGCGQPVRQCKTPRAYEQEIKTLKAIVSDLMILSNDYHIEKCELKEQLAAHNGKSVNQIKAEGYEKAAADISLLIRGKDGFQYEIFRQTRNVLQRT